ncbi:hypothetical protein J4212_05585 [Candidatus Woesearchaeota archaeon]|nr:hypothetical protein [Candidatus Woesearchaeota archaeon]
MPDFAALYYACDTEAPASFAVIDMNRNELYIINQKDRNTIGKIIKEGGLEEGIISSPRCDGYKL